jgi:endonuclease/exonuclease/phosphatase (EEP) superfamily protein YafD
LARIVRWIWWTSVWAFTLGLVMLVILRGAGYEGRVTITAAEAAIGIMLLPAYGVLVLAVARRRQVLAVVAAIVAIAHVAWALPSLIPHHAPASGRHLRLMSFNVRYSNPRTDAVVREFNRVHADVVVSVELTRRLIDRLRSNRAFISRFPEYVLVPGAGGGIGVWSRYPLSEPDVVEVGGRASARVTVDVRGRKLRLWAIHTIAPVGGDRRSWLRALHTFRRQARAARRHGPPLILAGDFNATGGNPSFARLLRDADLRDSHVVVGRGWATTWPAGHRFPTFVRLDHILVPPGIGVRSVREGSAAGSDHRPIIADLRL